MTSEQLEVSRKRAAFLAEWQLVDTELLPLLSFAKVLPPQQKGVAVVLSM